MTHRVYHKFYLQILNTAISVEVSRSYISDGFFSQSEISPENKNGKREKKTSLSAFFLFHHHRHYSNIIIVNIIIIIIIVVVVVWLLSRKPRAEKNFSLMMYVNRNNNNSSIRRLLLTSYGYIHSNSLLRISCTLSCHLHIIRHILQVVYTKYRQITYLQKRKHIEEISRVIRRMTIRKVSALHQFD